CRRAANGRRRPASAHCGPHSSPSHRSGCNDMVAALADAPSLRPMRPEDLDAVLAIELASYPFPWTRGIFEDCLRCGYNAWVAERQRVPCGYGLLSMGAGEAHVLNLCVAASARRLGLGRLLLQRLLQDAREASAERVFL